MSGDNLDCEEIEYSMDEYNKIVEESLFDDECNIKCLPDEEEALTTLNEREPFTNVNEEQVPDSTDTNSSLDVLNNPESENELRSGSDSYLSDYHSDDHADWSEDSDIDRDPLGGWSTIPEAEVPQNPNESFNLNLEDVYENVYTYRKALQEYSIRAGIKTKKLHNEKTRVTVKCADPKCNWRVHASPLPDGTTYMIKSIHGVHQCLRVDKVKEANSNWIAEKLVPILRAHPDMKMQGLRQEIKDKFGVKPKYMQLYKSKLKALDIIQGKLADSYTIMPQYAAMVTRTNPESVLAFQFYTDAYGNIPREPAFKRFFMGIKALAKGFLEGCQSFLGLDGCHLKGKYGGILLSACGIDGNLGLYPVAFAIVENENKESWDFFLHNLSKMLGGFSDDRPWHIMSDRQKGLEAAVDELVPTAVHKRCCRHIYANLRGKHPGILVKKLFWAAARSYTRVGFTKAMNRLKEVKPDAYEYVMNIGCPSTWGRHAFGTQLKNDHITNNISESLNQWVGELRHQPIQKLMDGLRAKIMHRLEVRYQRARRWKGKVTGRVRKILNVVVDNSVRCDILVGGSYEFQVNDENHHYIVDLLEHSCNCRFWDLTGIPCRHVAAAVAYKRHDLENYVNPHYSTEKHLRAYTHRVKGIPHPDFWPEIEGLNPQKILPPIIKRQPGRPKKHRNREVGEAPRVIPSRKRGQIKCGTCGLLGHNKRGCSQGTNNNATRRNNGQPSLAESGTTQAIETQGSVNH